MLIIPNSIRGLAWKFAQEEDEQKAEDVDARRDTFSIPEHRLAYLQKKVDRIRRVADRLKLPPVEMEILGKQDKEFEKKDGTKYYLPFVQIKIIGEAPILNGWTFVARVLHGEHGNILKTVPGQLIPADYRETPPICEHCNLARNRKDTFVVTDGTTWKQVGSNCLADFLGHPDPRGYANLAEGLANMHDELLSMEGEGGDGGYGQGGGDHGLNAIEYVSTVVATRRAYGWMSRGKAREREEAGMLGGQATADTAWLYLTNIQARGKMTEVEVGNDDSDLAEKAIDWARNLRNRDDLNDYLWNLAVAASSPVVYSKTAGIMASIVNAYEDENSVIADNTSPGEGYVGRRGRPIAIQGVLNEVKAIGAYRGTSWLHEMEDINGNVVKWFSDSDELTEEKGTEIKISGIVKEHKEYQGRPETMLSGVRVLDDQEYESEMETITKGEEKDEVPPKVFQSGDKILVKVRILDKKYIEGQYGTTTLLTMSDEETGQMYKWFSSAMDLDVGMSYNLKATVKGEEEYKGRKSTMLTRCKLLTDEEMAAGGKEKKFKKMPPKKRKALEEEAKQIQVRENEIRKVVYDKGQERKVSNWISSVLDDTEDEYRKMIKGMSEKAEDEKGFPLWDGTTQDQYREQVRFLEGLWFDPEVVNARTEILKIRARQKEINDIFDEQERLMQDFTEQRNKMLGLAGLTRENEPKTADVNEWTSGWNSPELPGRVFASKEHLKNALSRRILA